MQLNLREVGLHCPSLDTV